MENGFQSVLSLQLEAIVVMKEAMVCVQQAEILRLAGQVPAQRGQGAEQEKLVEQKAQVVRPVALVAPVVATARSRGKLVVVQE